MSSYVELPADLDTVPPGPRLGVVLASLDLSRYNGHQLVEILSAQQRQVSYENARLLAVARELTYTPGGVGTEAPARRVEPDRFSGTEIAFALSCTEYAAQALIVVALTAVDLVPALHTALAQGRIDLTKARMIATELACATPQHARLVVDKVLRHAHRATTPQLRALLRRALLRLDPDAVRQRHAASLQSRRFDHDSFNDGTASLIGSFLPIDKAAPRTTMLMPSPGPARPPATRAPCSNCAPTCAWTCWPGWTRPWPGRPPPLLARAPSS